METPFEHWVVVASADLLGHGTASAATARAILRRELCQSVDATCLDDLMLATSELVTNAAMYSCEPYRLTIAEQPMTSRLRVAVYDNNPTPLPPLRPLDPWGVSGRGLHIVDTVSQCWGYTPTDTGKQVWFEVQP